MVGFREDLWKEALSSVQNQFDIEQLLPEQEQSLRAFIDKGNVFVNLPTGFGKSLTYQGLPILYDVLHSRDRGSSLLLVISPLKSLMEDQVAYLASKGVPAVRIIGNEDTEIIQQVINGCYPLEFGSPEAVLSITTWRDILSSSAFKEKLIGVAIDEANCITQW